jgi:hypothetical protein
MSPRSNFESALRVFGGMALALVLCSTSAQAAPILPGAAESQRIVVAASEDATAVRLALQLLSRRPEKVVVIDPDDATPEGRKILAKSDAFITSGGRIVYINGHI